jgi:YD repeat-containing protein
MRRPIYEISPDPDGAGALKRTITRHVYDDAGQEIRTELGEGQATDGSDFVRKSYVANTFNNSGLKTRVAAYTDGNGTPLSVTDYSFDTSGRQICSTVRMNPGVYGALPSDACTLGATGTWGPDRITKTLFNAGSQVTEVIRASGVTTANGFPQTLQQSYARYTYTNNGLKASEKDANGNLSTLEYDGLDRLKRLRFEHDRL